METLFFKAEKSLDEIAKLILLKVLGINNTLEGDSSFCANGYYFVGTVLGIRIKIAGNNYDYEDMFNYMISIDKTPETEFMDNTSILNFAEIVASLIAKQIGVEVAIELELRRTEKFRLKIFSFKKNKMNTEIKEF